MSMLELRRVSKSYGQGSAAVQALREVSLTAGEGEMVAVMGPSGPGKSTLLTIAGTLEEPTAGEVLIAGQPISKVSRAVKARLRRRAIGYVFQDFNLLPGPTVAENVSLPLNAQAVMRLLHEACKDGGMTAVVVTHDAQLASWADRVVFLRDGLVADHTVSALGPESLLTPERNR